MKLKKWIGYTLLIAFLVGMYYKISNSTDDLDGSEWIIYLMVVVFLLIILGIRRILQY